MSGAQQRSAERTGPDEPITTEPSGEEGTIDDSRAPSRASGVETGAASASELADQEDTVDDGEWAAAELSPDRAEELASKFKASWESWEDDPSSRELPAAVATAAPAPVWSAGATTATPAHVPAAANVPAASAVHPAPPPTVPAVRAVAAPAMVGPTGDLSTGETLLPVTRSNRSLVLGGVGAL